MSDNKDIAVLAKKVYELSLVEEGKLPWHGTHVLRKTCGTRIADGGGGVSAVASRVATSTAVAGAPARSTRWRADGGVITPAANLP